MRRLVDGHKRRFLLGSAVLAGGLYAAALGRGALRPCGRTDIYPAYAELEPFLRIGRSYLAIADASERQRLAGLRLSQDANPARAFLHDLEREADTVAADFERDDVLVCEGWVLSRTEVSLCAALAARIG